MSIKYDTLTAWGLGNNEERGEVYFYLNEGMKTS